jgi:hypothetical protein
MVIRTPWRHNDLRGGVVRAQAECLSRAEITAPAKDVPTREARFSCCSASVAAAAQASRAHRRGVPRPTPGSMAVGRLAPDFRGHSDAPRQVRGLGRRGWSVGRVLFPGASRRPVRRPSISDRRCRRPRAVHPRTRAGSPRTCAVRPCSGRGLPSRSGRPDRWWSLAPPFHPYLLWSRQARPTRRRSVFCGTVPRIAPGGCCPPPCPREPGPSSTPPGCRGRPTNPSAPTTLAPRGLAELERRRTPGRPGEEVDPAFQGGRAC